MSILLILLLLSVIIIIHELGHFIAAKKSGVLVEEFGVGLPPRIFGLKIGETIYSLNLLPFGGFVKLFGEEGAELEKKTLPKKLINRTFTNKKPWQKALIISAGVMANFLLGWLIISYLFTQGVPIKSDKIIIEKVVKNSPAEKANLKPGDIIEAIKTKDGYFKLSSTEEFINLTKKNAGNKITLAVIRDKDKKISLEIIPRKSPPKDQGPLGVVITSFIEKKYPWYQAPFFGLKESLKTTGLIVKELVKTLLAFFTFQKPQVDVAGPVGIVKITHEAIKFGHNAVLQIIGLLSLNLAVVNILPFPALDGGRLSLVLYEAVTRKKTNPRIERYLNLIGFAILLSLIILVTINDIKKLF